MIETAKNIHSRQLQTIYYKIVNNIQDTNVDFFLLRWSIHGYKAMEAKATFEGHKAY